MAATQPPTEQEKTEQNAKLRDLGKRLNADPKLAEQYKADPVATLKSNGVSESTITALRAQTAAKKGEDVSGYYYYDWVDTDYTYYWYYIY